MKLRIKYCGGCNPEIDRTRLVKEVLNLLEDKVSIELVATSADVGIVVGGCTVCCVNLTEIEDQAEKWVVVGGNLVEHRQVSSDQLPQKIASKVMEIFQAETDNFITQG